MVKTKHDTTSFENCGYQREIFDGNALYDGFLRAKQGSDAVVKEWITAEEFEEITGIPYEEE